MSNNKEQKSGRAALVDRLRSRYPDQDFSDDEALYAQVGADYDDYADQLSGYQEREQGMADLFTRDPRSAKVLMDWRDGKDLIVALIEEYGQDDLAAALEDPANAEKIAAANQQWMERTAKEKDYEEQYAANFQESVGTLERYKSENGVSDDEMDAAIEWLFECAANIVIGKYSPEMFAMALKAKGYDSAVAEAGAAGEARGRNAKISEKLRSVGRGDGVPALGGGGVSDTGAAGGPLSSLGGDGASIWDRGGVRRYSRKG